VEIVSAFEKVKKGGGKSCSTSLEQNGIVVSNINKLTPFSGVYLSEYQKKVSSMSYAKKLKRIKEIGNSLLTCSLPVKELKEHVNEMQALVP